MSTTTNVRDEESEFSDSEINAAILAMLEQSSESSSISDGQNTEELILIPPEVSRKLLKNNGMIDDQIAIVKPSDPMTKWTRINERIINHLLFNSRW